MNFLKNYTKRIFLLTENVRDELILSDNRIVQLDRYLYLYLTEYLGYDSVAFLDAKGIYYFDTQSLRMLKNRNKTTKVKGHEKLIKRKKKILLNPAKKNNQVVNPEKLRFTYEGDIIEIIQFAIHHLKNDKPKFAFIIYDGTLLEKLTIPSDVWVQFQGMLRNEIFQLPSENRNILIWVDGEDYQTMSNRFQRLGLDFLFSINRESNESIGKAQLLPIPNAQKDEIIKAISLHSLQKKEYPSIEEVKKFASTISGNMKLKNDSIKTLRQYLNEEPNFWQFIKKKYGLQSDTISSKEKLKNMIGISKVKEEIYNLINGIEKTKLIYEKEFKLTPQRFKKPKESSLPHIPHIALLGNPGTGKTTIARIISNILKEEGILETGHIVEVSRADLVAGYSGQTALKTKQQIQKAIGGVLFIDEAYELVNDDQDSFGKEALAELVKGMSDFAGEFMIIFAGYKNETKKMLEENPGCARRIQQIELPDYSAPELTAIMKSILSQNKFLFNNEIYEKADIFCSNLLSNRENFGGNHFGNADVVIKQIQKATQKMRAEKANELQIEHFEYKHFFESLETEAEDLENLIGLENVKNKLKILIKRLKLEKNLNPGNFLFIGNPGTGKTIVAKQMAKKFYEMKLLNSAKVNIKSASELIGQYLGETEKKVLEILNNSLDGILFIDEAHQLASKNDQNNFGKKALQTIVPFMENHRNDICIIFAGYPKELEELLSNDPGLKGRFNNHITFPNYSDSELVQIFHQMFSKESAYKLDMIPNDFLEDIFGKIRKKEGKHFSNARTVRNFIEKIKDEAIQDAKSDQKTIIIFKKNIISVEKNWR